MRSRLGPTAVVSRHCHAGGQLLVRRSCKLTFLMPLPARAANFELTATPSTKEAQAIADELYAGFVSEVRRHTPRLGLTRL